MRFSPYLILCLLFMLSGQGHGQYFGEQVLEKSFERSDFFFQPAYLNPFGIGRFGAVAPGLIDDPLLDLRINPAYPASDSLGTHTLYLDFRNAREIRENPYTPYRGMMDYAASSWIPYPRYFMETRDAPEPVFSAAWIGRPLAGKSGFTTGVTLQVISQDEPYYAVPQDIYKSNVGLDYNGSRMSEGFSGPVTDRGGGSDAMHQEGHFLSAFSALSIGSRLDLGIRLAHAGFSREGTFGSYYSWDNRGVPDYENASDYRTERVQDYDHWDVSAGLNLRLPAGSRIGASAGYLKGKAGQTLDDENISMYRWGNLPDTINTSFYYQEGYGNRVWDHDGRTLYGGVNLRMPVQENTTLDIHYRLRKESVDISLAAGIMDTSFSRYRYEGSGYDYRSQSVFALHDERTGAGTREALRHDFSAAVWMRPAEKTRVRIGFHFEAHDIRTATEERVLARRFVYNEWTNTYDGHRLHRESVEEDKTLFWDLHIQSSRFQIPVIVEHRLSDLFELTFGIDRSLTRYRITDETLAVFEYRDITVNGVSTDKTHFGERYREPVERRSRTETSMLAGCTISPSDKFRVRLLAVPRYMKTWEGTRFQVFQWWISFHLSN